MMSNLRIILFSSLFFLTFFTVSVFAQEQATDTSTVIYENPSDSLFPGYESASHIIDYYKTEGASEEGRYRYEIIVIDSLLSLTFQSPEFEGFHYVDYQKERLLSNDERRDLASAFRSAKLTQAKPGIPKSTAADDGQEVLIVRSKEVSIAGGLAWNGNNDQELRKNTASIGGEYDAFFLFLRAHFFPDLDGLMDEAIARD